MKKAATYFLRTALLFIGLGVFAACTLLLPRLWQSIAIEFPDYSYAVYGVLIAMFTAAIPFFTGLYGAWRLLDAIDAGMAFTTRSAKSVKTIMVAAGIISLLYLVCLPLLYIWADNDDAPGLIIIGLVLVGVPMVISVFASLLHRLICEATSIKSENDLTV